MGQAALNKLPSNYLNPLSPVEFELEVETDQRPATCTPPGDLQINVYHPPGTSPSSLDCPGRMDYQLVRTKGCDYPTQQLIEYAAPCARPTDYYTVPPVDCCVLRRRQCDYLPAPPPPPTCYQAPAPPPPTVCYQTPTPVRCNPVEEGYWVEDDPYCLQEMRPRPKLGCIVDPGRSLCGGVIQAVRQGFNDLGPYVDY